MGLVERSVQKAVWKCRCHKRGFELGLWGLLPGRRLLTHRAWLNLRTKELVLNAEGEGKRQ